MTRSSSSGMIIARQNKNLVSRDFVLLSGRDRSTNGIAWLNIWNDIGTVSANILDIDTLVSTAKTFIGDGALLSVDQISLTCEQQITDRTLAITLSQINNVVNDFVRTYDLHEQAAFVYQGDLDPDTHLLGQPAECVFAGFIDTNPISTGSVGDSGNIVINLRSHTTELTRTNTLKRSHSSEILRDPSDTFYQDTSTVGDWLIYLGQPTPKQMKAV